MDDYEANQILALTRLGTLTTLRDVTLAREGKGKILEDLESSHPGFKEFYGSPEYQDALESHPRIKETIEIGEGLSSAQDVLPDLYLTLLDVARARGYKPQQQTTSLSPLRSETTSAALTEEQIFRSTEESKRADLSSKNRRALIEQLESSGVADIEF